MENCSDWAAPARLSSWANERAAGLRLRGGAAARGRGGDGSRRPRGGDQRGVRDGGQWTSVTLEIFTPATPSTVTVVPVAVDWTLSTLPVAAPAGPL